MTERQQYTAGAYFQLDGKNSNYSCPSDTVVTDTDPTAALRQCIEASRQFALKNFYVGREFDVKYVVCIGTTPDVKWYGYVGSIKVNYKRAKNRTGDPVTIFVGEKFVFTTCDIPNDAPRYFIGIGCEGVIWFDRNGKNDAN